MTRPVMLDLEDADGQPYEAVDAMSSWVEVARSWPCSTSRRSGDGRWHDQVAGVRGVHG